MAEVDGAKPDPDPQIGETPAIRGPSWRGLLLPSSNPGRSHLPPERGRLEVDSNTQAPPVCQDAGSRVNVLAFSAFSDRRSRSKATEGPRRREL